LLEHIIAEKQINEDDKGMMITNRKHSDCETKFNNNNKKKKKNRVHSYNIRNDGIIIIQFNSIQFNSLLFMCRVNSHRANYRPSTVQIYITT
jgi:hypothetical protein